MALLSKAQILSAEDRKFQTVTVPEWGGDVRVGSMTALQRQRYFEALIAKDESGLPIDSAHAVAMAFSVVDDKGEAIFSPEDIMALGAKSGTALERVFRAVTGLNKLTAEAVEAEKGN